MTAWSARDKSGATNARVVPAWQQPARQGMMPGGTWSCPGSVDSAASHGLDGPSAGAASARGGNGCASWPGQVWSAPCAGICLDRGEEALAALPGGTGPGALTARADDDRGPPGNGGSGGPRTPTGDRGFLFARRRPTLRTGGPRARDSTRRNHDAALGSWATARSDGRSPTRSRRAAGRARSSGARQQARHDPARFAGADVVVDATRGHAVRGNVEAALAAGVRRFVIGTTAWDADRPAVAGCWARRARPPSSPPTSAPAWPSSGDWWRAARSSAAAPGLRPVRGRVAPAGKADRPSGTARDLAARILAVDPARDRVSDADRRPRRARRARGGRGPRRREPGQTPGRLRRPRARRSS